VALLRHSKIADGRSLWVCKSGSAADITAMTEFDPMAVIDRVEIPQSSCLSAHCDVLSLKSEAQGLLPCGRLPRNACLDTRENGIMRICFILLSVLGFAFASEEAWAQTWPTRPIRAIVAFAAGGIVDVMARVVFDQLSAQLRQPVVVENRAGAGTAIAAAFVAKSDPDGYTVLVNSSAHTISPSLQPNLTFDPARDFSAVIPLGSSPMCWSFHHLGALKLLVTLLLPREPSQARSILPRPASAAESI